ncbi:hypothetical protein Rsub_01023 [Raphidocelis subcapitata]|uniref:PPM-type phosphatase domain-containing protein n=1 Tax=Raphidocelis subcapitata TaxID=307507 RepID=A0A2V0NLL7_9CHLO|nr:hypothetical protein Rsub_01023 [Raphidocelis subcapitata]|eukprot:GBF88311.1 hypothetical protein Rsub_01023 [Raphidocelis subcapitata]
MEAVTSREQVLCFYADHLVHLKPEEGRHWAAWAAFDGYGGTAAAATAAAALPGELAARLPARPLPEAADRGSPEAVEYASRVRMAVVAAFLAVAGRVAAGAQIPNAPEPPTGGAAAARRPAPAPAPPALPGADRPSSGTTATVIVQTGRLLTVANVGGARALLDVGVARVELTEDDRLGCNEDEEERLAAAGTAVAQLKMDLSGPCSPGEPGCGPLRAWPGGVRHSRAMCGPGCSGAVLAYPHVRQVWLPPRPCRVILATDGVWDAFDTPLRAAALIQSVSTPNAAAALAQHPGKKGCRRTDRSAFVVDFRPRGAPAGPRRASAGSVAGSVAGGGSEGGSVHGGNTFHRHAKLARQSRSLGSGGGPRSAPGSSASLSTWGRGGGGGGDGAAGSPNASWQAGVSRPSLGWSLVSGTSLGAKVAGLGAQPPLRGAGPAAGPARGRGRARRAAGARALLAALLPRWLARRRSVGGIPTDPGGSVRAGDSFISLTVARLDAWEMYASRRYGTCDLVLAALDAAVRAAAAASEAGEAEPQDAAPAAQAGGKAGAKPRGGGGGGRKSPLFARHALGRFVTRLSRSMNDAAEVPASVLAGGGGGGDVSRLSIALTE